MGNNGKHHQPNDEGGDRTALTLSGLLLLAGAVGLAVGLALEITILIIIMVIVLVVGILAAVVAVRHESD